MMKQTLGAWVNKPVTCKVADELKSRETAMGFAIGFMPNVQN